MGRRHDDVLLVLGAVGLVDGEGLLRLQAIVHRQRGRHRLNVLGEGLGVQLQLLHPVVHGYDALHEGDLQMQTLGQRLALLHLAEGEQDAGGADGYRGEAVQNQNHNQQRRSGDANTLHNVLLHRKILLPLYRFCARNRRKSSKMIAISPPVPRGTPVRRDFIVAKPQNPGNKTGTKTPLCAPNCRQGFPFPQKLCRKRASHACGRLPCI